ncbi:efflux RND transporter periplasmic adaptor subunit [Marinivivus vitaminiproducens]|uniref:efflux RND transporter periplasmic adaptor subunit n=1 Tax=Marinivivus vitaminiproducens TaxID=3035935 RepID=UPI003FA03358
MTKIASRSRLWGAGLTILSAAAIGGGAVFLQARHIAQADSAAETQPQATPVSIATVESRNASTWNAFSGRLEAVERVEVRSRVAGAVLAAHFREGALVKAGDLLVTIDPAPFQAEVDRAKAEVTSAEARVTFAQSELERGRKLYGTRAVSASTLDERTNAQREAEAALQAARAALQSAQLNLDYTQVRAPVSGRVGKIEITQGNLIAAGPNAPVLTTLVSTDPIYASFNADEAIVVRALADLPVTADGVRPIDLIPVRMGTVTSPDGAYTGQLQLIDNQVDAASGTVRVRAEFANPDGKLIPGQFARIEMGQSVTEPLLAINERAVGTDQDKRFVLVVDDANHAVYREVKLGTSLDGLRVVTDGLAAGERIVVNGLQRIRPGAVLAPETVAMDTLQPIENDSTAIAQR